MNQALSAAFRSGCDDVVHFASRTAAFEGPGESCARFLGATSEPVSAALCSRQTPRRIVCHAPSPGGKTMTRLHAFLSPVSSCNATSLTMRRSHHQFNIAYPNAKLLTCKISRPRVANYQHPREGLHFVEELPMLASHVSFLGSPEPGNPGFGCLSGDYGCRSVRHHSCATWELEHCQILKPFP